MPDAVAHIGENSAEHVAYRLFELIVDIERKAKGQPGYNRQYVLDTYAERVDAVRDGKSWR
jgi:hypothetical protein